MTGSRKKKAKSQKKGNVCLVTSSFPRWPDDEVSGFVLDLAVDLMAEGWRVDVLAPHCKGAARKEEMRGVSVIRFRYLWPEALETLAYGEGGAIHALRRRPWNILKLPFFLIAQMIALYRLVRRREIDVINSHWLLPQGLTAGIVAGLTGIPHVATAHGGDVLGLQSGIFAAAKRMALARARVVTVNSNVTEAAVWSLTRDRLPILRIPLGASQTPVPRPARLVELRDRYTPAGGPLLLFVGRLIPEKGCSDLLAAVSVIARTHPDMRLLIAGDGPEKAALEARTLVLNVERQVVFLGWLPRDELADIYHAADIFVAAPTRVVGGAVEAFGLVFVEAALAGLPTVSTHSGGIGDVVVDGETGFLVGEGAYGDLAAAVVYLLENPDRSAQMGGAARERAEAHFTRGRAAKAFSDLFAEVRKKS
ncbi:MAG: glycosyltransferase [Proteobacteria bacterium]|nr:glycosyltransferase [Pseudomonadota bacterium]